MKLLLFIFGVIGLLIAAAMGVIPFIYPSVEHFIICWTCGAYIVFRVIDEGYILGRPKCLKDTK